MALSSTFTPASFPTVSPETSVDILLSDVQPLTDLIPILEQHANYGAAEDILDALYARLHSVVGSLHPRLRSLFQEVELPDAVKHALRFIMTKVIIPNFAQLVDHTAQTRPPGELYDIVEYVNMFLTEEREAREDCWPRPLLNFMDLAKSKIGILHGPRPEEPEAEQMPYHRDPTRMFYAHAVKHTPKFWAVWREFNPEPRSFLPPAHANYLTQRELLWLYRGKSKCQGKFCPKLALFSLLATRIGTTDQAVLAHFLAGKCFKQQTGGFAFGDLKPFALIQAGQLLLQSTEEIRRRILHLYSAVELYPEWRYIIVQFSKEHSIEKLADFSQQDLTNVWLKIKEQDDVCVSQPLRALHRLGKAGKLPRDIYQVCVSLWPKVPGFEPWIDEIDAHLLKGAVLYDANRLSRDQRINRALILRLSSQRLLTAADAIFDYDPHALDNELWSATDKQIEAFDKVLDRLKKESSLRWLPISGQLPVDEMRKSTLPRPVLARRLFLRRILLMIIFDKELTKKFTENMFFNKNFGPLEVWKLGHLERVEAGLRTQYQRNLRGE